MSIVIKRNKDLKIKKVKMKCDPKLSGTVVEPLQNANFCYIITAPPGSGKTNLIINLLKNKNMYRHKFDKIYWFSPSAHTAPIPIPEDQIIEGYDCSTVDEIIDSINDESDDEDDEGCNKNILFIFDDCVSDLKKSDKTLAQLAWNRRHKIRGGSLSIIFTTQMLNAIPTTIRRACTGLFVFMTNSENEREIIKKEFINLPSGLAEQLMDIVFSEEHAFLFIHTNKQKIGNKYYRNFDKITIPGYE